MRSSAAASTTGSATRRCEREIAIVRAPRARRARAAGRRGRRVRRAAARARPREGARRRRDHRLDAGAASRSARRSSRPRVVDATLGTRAQVPRGPRAGPRPRAAGARRRGEACRRALRPPCGERPRRRRGRAEARHVRADPARGRASRSGPGRLQDALRALDPVRPRRPRRGLPRAALHDRLAPRRPRGLRRRLRARFWERAPTQSSSAQRPPDHAGSACRRRSRRPRCCRATGWSESPQRRARRTRTPRRARTRSRPGAPSDELLRERDFARYRAATSCCACARPSSSASPRALADAGRSLRSRGRRTTAARSTCAARCARRCARRATRSSAPGARPSACRAGCVFLCRRVGLDGAVRARHDDVPAGRRARRPARRGVHLRHAPDAADAVPRRAAIPIARSSAPRRAVPDWAGGTRIGENAARPSTTSGAAGR